MKTMTEQLGIYLRDHRAGAAAGSDLARRAADENDGTPYGHFLSGLADEIEADVMTLEQIMSRFDVTPDLLKNAGAKVGEKLGRLKPNGQLTGYSPLSRVLEMEGLRAGVQGKLSLWQSLREVAPAHPELDEAELDELVASAEGQLDGLRKQHGLAAREAFA
ncbi:MAG: hypothetical protein QOG15_57 [Solirubrobacteraceae bacterium]|jgi:hypothetical protein|nr:hypothetical protein [Solirubrobacteraceae bacterium]